MRLKTSFCNDAHFYFRRTSKKSWFSFYFRYSNILLRNVLFLKGKAFTKFHLKTYLIIMGIKWTVFISKQMYSRFSGVIWKTWQKLNKKSIYVFKWPDHQPIILLTVMLCHLIDMRNGQWNALWYIITAHVCSATLNALLHKDIWNLIFHLFSRKVWAF